MALGWGREESVQTWMERPLYPLRLAGGVTWRPRVTFGVSKGTVSTDRGKPCLGGVVRVNT